MDPTKPTEPVKPTESETTKPTDTVTSNTVTFSNSLSWSGTIYCYYWSDANTTMTSWPGVAMKKSGTNEYGQALYTFDVPNGATKLIFTNGSEQTVDITTQAVLSSTTLQIQKQATATTLKYGKCRKRQGIILAVCFFCSEFF